MPSKISVKKGPCFEVIPEMLEIVLNSLSSFSLKIQTLFIL